MSVDKDLTVSKLHDCYEQVCKLREEHEAAKKVASDIWEDFQAEQAVMLSLLDAAEFDEFKGRDGLKMSVVTKKSAKMPIDYHEKEKLFEYLREKGDFDSLISIHAAKFNSYYNQEREQAIAEDPEAALMWSMPGVEEPREYRSLKVPTVKKIQGAKKND